MTTPTTLQKFIYSPLGWSQWLYGPLFIFAGIFLLWAFVANIQKIIANDGVNGILCRASSCNSSELLIMGALWAGFVLVICILLGSGIAMLESRRTTWIADHMLHTTRGVVAIAHKQYPPNDMTLSVEKVPVVMVMPNNRVSHMGFRYAVDAHLPTKSWRGKKRVLRIAAYPTEPEATQAMQNIQNTLWVTPNSNV